MSDEPHKIIDENAAPVTQLEQEQNKAAAELSGPNDGAPRSMEVKVHSPYRDYYDGPAFSISAANMTGPFDILPQHHNFISLLSRCELVVRTVNQGDQKIRIAGGIMHVKADKIIVFLDV